MLAAVGTQGPDDLPEVADRRRVAGLQAGLSQRLAPGPKPLDRERRRGYSERDPTRSADRGGRPWSCAKRCRPCRISSSLQTARICRGGRLRPPGSRPRWDVKALGRVAGTDSRSAEARRGADRQQDGDPPVPVGGPMPAPGATRRRRPVEWVDEHLRLDLLMQSHPLWKVLLRRTT
jgi:hypothetical protein